MTDFTRVTIVGSVKRATLVVPSDESLGQLIPRLMELLEERVTSVARPLTLVRLTGEQLDATQTAAEQGVSDGEVLRLLRLDEAPPPPEVSDVTDTVSETLATRQGLWSAAHRTVLGSLALGVLALVAGLEVPENDGVRILPLVVWAAAALAGFGLALGRRGTAARALLGVALGLSLPSGMLVAPALQYGLGASGDVITTKSQYLFDLFAFTVPPTLLFGWLSLLLVAGLGQRSRPATLGSGIGVVSAAVLIVLLAAGLPGVEVAAIMTTLAVVGCGLVPWYAMSASGLTGLDDQVMAGRLAERTAVLRTVDDAYSALTWTTFAVATALVTGLAGLAVSQEPWSNALAGLAVLIAALRTRAFPLAAQSWALWVAVLIPVVLFTLSSYRVGALAPAVLLGFGLLAAALVIAQPAVHQRASLRRVGNLLETLAMIALIPVLLGSFGVFAELLGSF
ncbi:EsaB/YukD family protein [Frondihabitans sp. VKM Ac-2883]|uniref:EsaB/YukD family protein n=1 Tax=Frondihabitans sp. VKM Ac-2883 TaxID=2783823 RepID=UPI00188B8380|nr:hypothetical protein [Frondihabitans sp. VKM Ac-2883]